MREKVLMIEGRRECYAPNQIYHTMTVGQLIDHLETYYDRDMPVMLKNDNGYTYGTIQESSMDECEVDCSDDVVEV